MYADPFIVIIAGLICSLPIFSIIGLGTGRFISQRSSPHKRTHKRMLMIIVSAVTPVAICLLMMALTLNSLIGLLAQLFMIPALLASILNFVIADYLFSKAQKKQGRRSTPYGSLPPIAPEKIEEPEKNK